MTEPQADKEQQQQLLRQIEAFVQTFWRLRKRNAWINTSLVVGGLVLGLGVSLAGFLNHGFLAGVLGIVITALIGLQNAFNFSERADFYHIIHNEAKALRDRLRYKVSTTQEFRTVVDELGILRNHAAKELPRGKGMETEGRCIVVPLSQAARKGRICTTGRIVAEGDLSHLAKLS